MKGSKKRSHLGGMRIIPSPWWKNLYEVKKLDIKKFNADGENRPSHDGKAGKTNKNSQPDAQTT